MTRGKKDKIFLYLSAMIWYYYHGRIQRKIKSEFPNKGLLLQPFVGGAKDKLQGNSKDHPQELCRAIEKDGICS